jgi:competence protein ComEA
VAATFISQLRIAQLAGLATEKLPFNDAGTAASRFRRIEANMKRILLCTVTLLALVGCTPADRTPEGIKKDAAKAATEAKRDVKEVAQDAKAAAKGVEDALKTNGTKTNDAININTASADDLESLPGINAAAARRIIARRPYGDQKDLVKRRVVSKAEYDRIASQIVAQ